MSRTPWYEGYYRIKYDDDTEEDIETEKLMTMLSDPQADGRPAKKKFTQANPTPPPYLSPSPQGGGMVSRMNFIYHTIFGKPPPDGFSWPQAKADLGRFLGHYPEGSIIEQISAFESFVWGLK
jgi:hypothetical protein